MEVLLTTIAGVKVWWDEEAGIIRFIAGLMIDADGAYKSYHPNNTGLDDYRNAGYPRYPKAYRTILVCGANGQPVTQKANDPAPGYWISRTAYEHSQYSDRNPLRYVDSANVPYAVVPPQIRKLVGPVVLGCYVEMRNTRNDKKIKGVLADIGPRTKIGEASIKAALKLGINPNPRNGGTASKIIEYKLYPGIAAPGYILKPMRLTPKKLKKLS